MIPVWLDIAESKVGIKEIAGPEANKDIVEFHSYTSLKATSDEVPWCSAFACYCMETSGNRSPRSAAARSWLNWGRQLEQPIEGCIVVMKRGNNPAQGHVGFFISQKQGLIRVLGGNQGDRVCYSWFAKEQVLDYRWPKEIE